MRVIKELRNQTKDLDTKEFLEFFLTKYDQKIAFASSLGAEDQVLTHMIQSIKKDTKIFTLDTGRLANESYELLEKTNSKYGIRIEVFFPNSASVEEYVNKKGINAFYESIQNRKECCRIRKIEPLKRALRGLEVWITGLRASQSITRSDIQRVEFDESFKLIKINPLAHWSLDKVWEYINDNDVPFNKLHSLGYESIGCAPCSRAISEGEDIREGRWWWENPEHKECGLHIKGEQS